jgi:hypothetical protein
MSAPAHRGPDFAQRRRRLDLILELFQSRPGQWISVHELARVGGFTAWRTRTSEARQQLVKAGAGTIEWNHEQIEGAYRFVPFVRLGPDPSQYREQRLF